MPYEIAEIVDSVPKGRTRGPKVDKYTELRELLGQVPMGKVAKVPMEKRDYRKFSAGIRAAAVRDGKIAKSLYKQEAAWVYWEPLTEMNKPKRRGGRRKASA